MIAVVRGALAEERRDALAHVVGLRAQDLLLVLTEDGEVVLVEASPTTEGAELGRFQGVAGKTWNNFALYGPDLVIRNAEEAAVYRLPQVEQ